MSQTFTVRTPDGVDLLVRDWPLAAGATCRGSALIVHGVGEHSGRYEHVAACLTEMGLAVRCHDQRGFGQSGGPKGLLPKEDALIYDAKMIYDASAADAASRGDHMPPFLIGHSMGGGVAARAVTGKWITPRGLVLSSPAIEPLLTPVQRALALTANLVAPNLQRPHGIDPETLTHDPDVVAAIRRDPLMHDRVTPRLVVSMINNGKRALGDAPMLRVPTLLLVAGDDKVVVANASRTFAERTPPGTCELHLYDGLFHEVFNERQPDRVRVFGDLRRWVLAQLADRRYHGSSPGDG